MGKIKRITCIILAALTIISAPLTSYMEAQAAEAGLWALAQMVENALISVGFSAAGYIKSNINISDRDFVNAYIGYLSSGGGKIPVMDVDFVQALNDTALIANYKAGDPLHLSNGSITVSGSKKEGIKVEFSKEAAKECGKAARKYLESDANKTDVTYDNDSLSADVGYDDLDITFSSRVITLANYESIYDASDCFAEPALDAMFKENGVSDNTHAVFGCLSGSRIVFICIPVDRSVVFAGVNGALFLSADAASRFVRSFALDNLSTAATYNAYKQYSSGDAFTLTFDRNSDTWSHSSGIPAYNGNSGYYNNSKVFNFQKFMALGGTVQNFENRVKYRTVFSYKTKGNIISYDTSRAVDYSDGVSFTFGDGDVTNGLDGYDLDTLLSYMSGLSEEMAEWRKQQSANQETIIEQNAEVIQQNKNILTAVGGINGTTAKINTGIGKAVSFLSSIAERLLDLPAAIFNAFSDTLGQFMTAERLETLINGIPVIFSGVLSDAYADTQISVLPGILSDVLSSVFPDAASVFETLADLPAYIISAVSGIQVKVPDITIPEIKVPDVTVPDVYVEAPAVTLNPTFDVTVANDYVGLSDVISDSVSSVMVDAFVPSETATLEKVGEMQQYFEFKDDIIKAVDDLRIMLFGITPSPILKIPIGKTTSKKYNYGTGNYIIIDVSWYAPYKQFGDKVILAIVWALFLWHMFLKLPGIISGTEGSIMAADRSYQKYLSGKD